jgi:hypothetical protein
MITDMDAWKIWDEIQKEVKEKILNAVWCSKCSAGVKIVDYSVVFCRKNKDDICLHGKCSVCGTNVTRVLD